ncbi:uracil-DNA glycosylase family protein [Aestuariimicrobium ganziense]|uniref:hypothetical protein n=1 Tax=Aestuariimicrobium ganziense TaxID=2773677 RepID=UPI001943DA70|nr:hypothetical protein [Aestuariimicrobium ganziense]
MARRLRHASHRRAQWDQRHQPQVKALNVWIESLADAHHGSPPLIAPHHRASRAELLVIGPGPTPAAVGPHGTGLLSTENDDAPSALLDHHLRRVGLDPDLCVPWGAVPWSGGSSSSLDLRAGAQLLPALVDLLPRLRVVLALGGTAQDCVTWYLRDQPEHLRSRGISLLRTYQLATPVDGPDEVLRTGAVEREQGVRTTFARVAELLGTPASPTLVA